MLKLKSITQLMAVVTGTILFVFILALVTYVSKVAHDDSMQEAKQNLSVINRDVVASTIDMIDQNVSLCKMLALQSYVQNFLSGEIHSIAENVKSTFLVYKGLNSIIIIDKNFMVTAGFTSDMKENVGQDVHDRVYAREALAGRDSVSGEIVQSKGTGKYIYIVSTPVRDKNGQILGVVAISIDWMNFLREHVLGVKVGKTGFNYMLNAKGLTIAHPNQERMLADASNMDFVRYIIEQKNGMSRYTYNGVDRFQVFGQVERTGWIVGTTIEETELGALANKQRNTLIISGLVVFAAMLAILVGVLSNQVVNPLRRLMAFTNEIAQGNYKAKLEGGYNFEIKELANDILAMTENLKNKLGFSEGVLNGIGAPMMVCGVTGQVTFTNQAMINFLGLTGKPQDYLGQQVGQLFYGDPYRDTITSQCLRERKNRSAKGVDMVLQSGKRVHMDTDVYMLYDLDGGLLGAIVTFSDLTAMREQQEKIEAQHQVMLGVANQANTVSGRVSTATEELSAQVEQSSRGVDEQSNRAAGTATAMEQMTASVLEVAKSAAKAAETSELAKQKAQQGSEVVDKVVKFMSQVMSNSHQSRTDMDLLGQQAESIGRILGVISDIADQTNLLALNAAIEAARAGDAGRGFAVVADEVRKLAEKTQVATKEVGLAIRGIQDGAKKNIDNVAKAFDTSQEAANLVEKSGESLKEIVRLVDLATDQVQAIATASGQQSSASEEINHSIAEISRIAGETAEAMRQSAQAVTELAEQAQALNNLIEELEGEKTSARQAQPQLGQTRPLALN